VNAFRTLLVIISVVLAGSFQRANADTATLTVLYHFGVNNGPVGPYDGSYPVQPPIVGTDGNLYGTTYYGGTNDDGTIYKMTPQGTLTTLYTFQGYDGIGPRGLLFETNGVLYGTTQSGGNGIVISSTETSICCGTIFSITPQGAFTSLFSFDTTNGDTSDSGVIPGGDGNYIGTTYSGGMGSAYEGTNAADDFGDGVQNPPGTIYKINSQFTTITTIHSFSGTDGANPGKEAVIGTDGNIYGTTLFGGAHDAGAVYQITSSGTFTLLYSFADGTDGAHPKAELVEGLDGNYYGTTLDGGGSVGKKWCGANGCGTAFVITPQGTLTTLHDFNGDPDPAHPGSLALGPDGNFYGTSFTGGTNHLGTVFMITPQGAVTALYQFRGADGSEPIAGLTLASDGSFYGATTAGGAHNQGTIFRVVISTNNPQNNCTFSLNATSVTLTTKGGSKNVSVKAVGTDCSWSATTTNPFITVTSGSTGTGNGKVAFTVPGNTNTTPLVGTINIAGLTFTVNQTAGGCTYKLSPKSAKLKSTAGTASVNVSPNLGDCTWTATTTNLFITITSGSSGTGKGKVTYSVPANTSTSTLTGTISIGGQNFTVIQAGVK